MAQRSEFAATGQRGVRSHGRWCLTLAALLILFSPGAWGATYYVAKVGASNSYPGTEAQPWATIQKAATTMVAGDIVYIKQGTYTELVNPARSGNAGQPITYSVYPGNTVTVDAENGTRSYCVFVNNRSYLNFTGLALTGATGGYGIYIDAGSNHINLDGLTVTATRIGICLHGEITPVSQITVSNCLCDGNTHYGIYLYAKVYDSTIGPGNRFCNTGPESSSYGIEITTDYPGIPADGAQNIRIIGNESDHNETQGLQTWNSAQVLISGNYFHHNGATGIQIEDGSRDIYVIGNICEYNSLTHEYETGIWIDDSARVVVANNLLRFNQIGLMITGTDGCIVRNNLIAHNDQGYATVNAMGINVDTGSNSVTVVHNTLYADGQTNSGRGGLNFATHPPVTNAVFANNIIADTLSSADLNLAAAMFASDYNLVNNSRALRVSYLGSNRTWAQYLTLSGQDANSLISAPLFTDAGTGDFSLQAASPAVDHGRFLTQTSGPGSGTTLGIADVSYFSDGMGLVTGDLIVVGSQAAVTITAVDRLASTLTLNSSRTWAAGDAVGYPYQGTKPDIGAYEYASGSVIPPPPTQTVTPTMTPTNSPTPVVSPTPSATASASRTATPTVSSSATASPYVSPTPTLTPTPTASPEAGRGTLRSRVLSPGLADGINDVLEFEPEVSEISVLDLRGRVVFHAQGSALRWEAKTTAGQRCPAGTYVVKITRRDGSRDYQSVVVMK